MFQMGKMYLLRSLLQSRGIGTAFHVSLFHEGATCSACIDGHEAWAITCIVYIYICACAYILLHVYMCMYKHVHTHIHTYKT